MRNYKTLNAWKIAMELVKEIYMLTKSYPREEIYGLTSQTRRAAVSVPSNIAEGMGRNHKADTVRFLHIARGSLYELETLVAIAINTEMIQLTEMKHVLDLVENTTKVLSGLISYTEKSKLK